MTENEALLRWLRVALSATRQLAGELSANGRPDPTYVHENGGSGVSLGPRAFLDGVKADLAILADHVEDPGNPGFCIRCGYEDTDAEGELHRYAKPWVCDTIRFTATRYRHVIRGWRGEWAS